MGSNPTFGSTIIAQHPHGEIVTSVMLPRQPWILAILTLGMGAAVAVSWFAFARPLGQFGLDPSSLVDPTRLKVYGVQFTLVGTLAYALARTRLRTETVRRVAGLAIAAWVGEGLLLTLVGEPLVANELTPSIAWYYWIVATAGPLQPMAAVIGGWLGLRRARSAASAGARRG